MLVILGIVVVVCVVVAVIMSNLKKRKAAQAWPTAQGTITASEIQRSHDNDGTLQEDALVSYSYTVNGKVYQGSRIGFITIGTALQLMQRYPVGKAVDVFYDPANPPMSVLQR